MNDGRRSADALRLAGAAAAAVLLLLLAAFWVARGRGLGGGSPYGARALIFATLALLFALFDGARRQGARATWRLLAIAAATSIATELLGLTTGWVFGRYTYAPEFRPRLFGVLPAVVPLVWGSLSYLARATASLLARRPEDPPPAFSAALLLGYDLVADPNHLARGGWRFLDGGVYAGVPLHNFVAWFVIAWGMFALVRRVEGPPPRSAGGRRGALLAAVIYLAVLVHESVFAWQVAEQTTVAMVGALLSLAVSAGCAWRLRRGARISALGASAE